LDGSATARVPAGRQPDTVLRLRGKGLPEFGGKAQRDLYIRLPINIAERLTPAERDLYERLKALEPKR
jgi:molecular chaperone DnaJ